MSHGLFSSLDSFVADSSAASLLPVRDVAGEYRPADADEVLQAAQRVLAGRVRGTDVLKSPAAVMDFLQTRLGNLPHEIFAVVHLDAQHRVLDYVEIFQGTVSQTVALPGRLRPEARITKALVEALRRLLEASRIVGDMLPSKS